MEQNYKNIYAIIAFLGREGLLEQIYNVHEDFFIYSIADDPEDAKPKGLFICEGSDFRAEYLDEAINSGACCYISEQKYENGTPAIIVNDIGEAVRKVREFVTES